MIASTKTFVLFSALVSLVSSFVPKGFAVPQTRRGGSSSFLLEAIPAGWVGGFKTTNAAFPYPPPSPDLSSLPALDNMENIEKLQRMQKVLWPEFSWLTIQGDPSSRCFQMFAPDISRIGYTNDGRVYSIICPQQGYGTALLGTMNVEVTVTGQRGWVDEPSHEVYADLSVTGKIWFSPPSKTNFLLKEFESVLYALDKKGFPFSKAQAIEVTTFSPGKPYQPLFSLKNGTDPSFRHPQHTMHYDDGAYGVAHLNVEIGPIAKTGDELVDNFNQLVLNVFNVAGGNILEQGNILSWNVWFNEPELVDQKEWKEHAKYWRDSINVNHSSPQGDGKAKTYFDGTKFKPSLNAVAKELLLIKEFFKNNRRLLGEGIQPTAKGTEASTNVFTWIDNQVALDEE